MPFMSHTSLTKFCTREDKTSKQSQIPLLPCKLRSLILFSVFAVHGLGSNPVSAWTYRRANGSSVRWLKDLLPYREGFGDIRITMLNHQTRWDSHAAAMTFEDHAAKLLDDIEDIHKVILSPDQPDKREMCL